MRYCPSCHSVYPSDFRTCPKDQTELLTASELQPGMVLRGKYEILAKLGAGGMATVYRARHLAFGEVRAIKVVNSRLADDEDFLRRFRNEAVVTRRLHHPNAVRVDDLDTTEEGRPFIVMEYVEGLNLREVIRRDGALSLRRAVRIARQVASALAAAHELGIVHRDIKPDNILLTGAGETETAKVLDFGIARVIEGALGDSHPATRTGMVVGTPQYISPEQAMGRRGSDLDGRADLYSLGVALYEMVTGRLPFESDTAMGIILHHLQTLPTPPHEIRPDLGIPAPLSDVLMRALEKDRDKRFASANDMGAALDAVLALPLPERPQPAAAASGPPRPATPVPIPADIDRQETRVMPRTPPAGGTAAVPAVATAPRTPPPVPSTPAPRPTPASASRPPASWTPVPSPTVVSGGGGRMATPPPLPPPAGAPSLSAPTGVFAPPGARRRRWWLWVAAAGVFFMFMKGRSRAPDRHDAQPSPSAEAGAAESGRSDPQIHDDVKRALRGNPRLRREDIDVDVDEGVVTLTGHASSAAVAREAEQMARGVAGVREVANTIEAEDAQAMPHPGASAEGFPVPPGVPRPPSASIHPIIPGVTAEHVQEMLREGHRAMDRGAPEEALAIFGSVLVMDPTNKEARDGMRDAGKAMGARGKVDREQLQQRLEKERALREQALRERLEQDAAARAQAQRDRDQAQRDRERARERERRRGPSPSPSPSS